MGIGEEDSCGSWRRIAQFAGFGDDVMTGRHSDVNPDFMGTSGLAGPYQRWVPGLKPFVRRSPGPAPVRSVTTMGARSSVDRAADF